MRNRIARNVLTRMFSGIRCRVRTGVLGGIGRRVLMAGRRRGRSCGRVLSVPGSRFPRFRRRMLPRVLGRPLRRGGRPMILVCARSSSRLSWGSVTGVLVRRGAGAGRNYRSNVACMLISRGSSGGLGGVIGVIDLAIRIRSLRARLQRIRSRLLPGFSVAGAAAEG